MLPMETGMEIESTTIRKCSKLLQLCKSRTILVSVGTAVVAVSVFVALWFSVLQNDDNEGEEGLRGSCDDGVIRIRPSCLEGQAHCTTNCSEGTCFCEPGYIGNNSTCTQEPLAMEILSMMRLDDPSVEAFKCNDNWREYTCGGWMNNSTGPFEDEVTEIFATLHEEVQETLEAIKNQTETPAGRFFSLCVDKNGLLNDGLNQVRTVLSPLLAAPTKYSVVLEYTRLIGRPNVFQRTRTTMEAMMAVDPRSEEEVEIEVLTVLLARGVYFANNWIPAGEEAFISGILGDLGFSNTTAVASAINSTHAAQEYQNPSTVEDTGSLVTLADLQQVIDDHNLQDVWNWRELLSISFPVDNPLFKVKLLDLSESYLPAAFVDALSLDVLKAYFAVSVYLESAHVLPSGALDPIPVVPVAFRPAGVPFADTSLGKTVFHVLTLHRKRVLSHRTVREKVLEAYHTALRGAGDAQEFVKIKAGWIRLNKVFRLDSIMPQSLPDHITSVQSFTDLLSSTRVDDCSYITEALDLLRGPWLKKVAWGENHKVRLRLLAETVKASVKANFEQLEWFDAATREAALLKVDKMEILSGYSDDEFLQNPSVGVNMTTFVGALNGLAAVLDKYRLQVVGAFPNPRVTLWESTSPYTVNAYYVPTSNCVILFAGLMQRRIFGPNNPAALNFGAAGSIIAHEITHGFDHIGREYDAYGRKIEWWTDLTLEKFTDRVKCLVDQYSSYSCCTPLTHIPGERFKTENIADNGGVRVSLKAMENFICDNPGLRDPSFSSLMLQWSDFQLFFIAWAQCWCSVYGNDEMRSYLFSSGVHSPSWIRNFAPLRNVEEFGSTFDCVVGDFMVTSSDRCVVY